MLEALYNKKIYVASEPVDLRLGLDGLADIVMEEHNHKLHDGSIYVFYNRTRNKIKILTWDINGLVLYYKRLDNLKFKFQFLSNKTNNITYEQLDLLLSGLNPMSTSDRKPLNLSQL